MSKGVIIIFSLTVLFILSMLLIKSLSNEDISSNHNLEKVEKGSIEKKILISGSIVPSEEILIKSQISGILKKVYVKVGQKINFNDSIALVEIIANPSNLEGMRNSSTIAKLKFKEANYFRNKKLYEKGVIAFSEFQSSETEYNISKESYYSSQEQFKIAKKGYSNKQKFDNVIKATSNGTILDIKSKIGSSIIERNNFNEGSTISVIANLDSLLFKGKINENEIKFLRNTENINITINSFNDIILKGKLNNLSRRGIQERGVVKFELEVNIIIPKKLKDKIYSGYSAVAEIISEQKDSVLIINERALIFENDSTYVEVLEKNKILKKLVKTGISDGINIEIKKGLKVGNNVIIQE